MKTRNCFPLVVEKEERETERGKDKYKEESFYSRNKTHEQKKKSLSKNYHTCRSLMEDLPFWCNGILCVGVQYALESEVKCFVCQIPIHGIQIESINSLPSQTSAQPLLLIFT